MPRQLKSGGAHALTLTGQRRTSPISATAPMRMQPAEDAAMAANASLCFCLYLNASASALMDVKTLRVFEVAGLPAFRDQVGRRHRVRGEGAASDGCGHRCRPPKQVHRQGLQGRHITSSQTFLCSPAAMPPRPCCSAVHLLSDSQSRTVGKRDAAHCTRAWYGCGAGSAALFKRRPLWSRRAGVGAEREGERGGSENLRKELLAERPQAATVSRRIS